MPAEQRGEAIRLPSGWWVLRYRDASGRRQRVRTSEGRIARFKTKTAALNQYRDVIAPQLRGERPVTAYTLGEFVPIFLERHAIGVRERTISTLRDRLRHPITAFGDQPLAELEDMTDEIARGRSICLREPGTRSSKLSANASMPPSAGATCM